MMMRRSAPLLVLLLAAGCAGDPDSRPENGFAVTDSAGVELVQNGRAGRWGASPAELQEIRRIGVLEGADALQFHQIRSLAVAPDGAIFVGNNQTATVRVFAPDGTFLSEFGGRGRGPGEFMMVNVVWVAGDDVAVTDWQGGGRTGVFTRDGRLLHFWTSTQPDGSRVMPIARTPGGWVAAAAPRWSVPPLAPGERHERPNRLHRFDPGTNTAGDVLHELPPAVLYGSPQTEGLDWALFAPATHSAFDAAGNLYISRGDPYRIDVFDPQGRHLRGVSRTYEPVPIREHDIERLKAMIVHRYDSVSLAGPRDVRPEAARVLARVERQRAFDPRLALPPLGRLLVSHDGSFWIERIDDADPASLEYGNLYGLFEPIPRETAWDLFDADGAFLATVELPARFRPLAVRGTEVTGAERGEFDVEYVVTYRAVQASRDPSPR